MTWNYRLVNMPSKNGGRKWLQLCEVYYDRKGRPIAYAAPCLGSDTKKGAAWVGRKIAKGMSKPPLHEEMFMDRERDSHGRTDKDQPKHH